MAARESERPRVRVAAVILVEDRLLLVRQSKQGHTYHLLPGGGVMGGETLSDALTREVEEETGITCRVGEPLLINDTIAPDGSRHLVNITFSATLTGGTLRETPADPSIDAIELLDLDSLDDLDLRPPIAAAIAEVLARDASTPLRYLGPLWVDE